MHNAVKLSIALVTCAALGSTAFAQAPTPTPPPAHPGLFSKLFHHPKPAVPGTLTTASPMHGHSAMSSTALLSGGIVGNKKSHVYHLPGDKGALPAPQNRVYFHSAAEAQAAGYHAAGSGSHKMARPMTHGTPAH